VVAKCTQAQLSSPAGRTSWARRVRLCLIADRPLDCGLRLKDCVGDNRDGRQRTPPSSKTGRSSSVSSGLIPLHAPSCAYPTGIRQHGPPTPSVQERTHAILHDDSHQLLRHRSAGPGPVSLQRLAAPSPTETPLETIAAIVERLTGRNLAHCPFFERGKMHATGRLAPDRTAAVPILHCS